MSYIGLIVLIVFSVVDPGEGPGGGGGGGAPIFLTKLRCEGLKKLFLIPGPPFCQAPYLNVWTCHWFLLKMQKRTQPIFSHLDLTLGQ